MTSRKCFDLITIFEHRPKVSKIPALYVFTAKTRARFHEKNAILNLPMFIPVAANPESSSSVFRSAATAAVVSRSGPHARYSAPSRYSASAPAASPRSGGIARTALTARGKSHQLATACPYSYSGNARLRGSLRVDCPRGVSMRFFLQLAEPRPAVGCHRVPLFDRLPLPRVSTRNHHREVDRSPADCRNPKALMVFEMTHLLRRAAHASRSGAETRRYRARKSVNRSRGPAEAARGMSLRSCSKTGGCERSRGLRFCAPRGSS